MVNLWNSLSQDVLLATTIDSFKRLEVSSLSVAIRPMAGWNPCAYKLGKRAIGGEGYLLPPCVLFLWLATVGHRMLN